MGKKFSSSRRTAYYYTQKKLKCQPLVSNKLKISILLTECPRFLRCMVQFTNIFISWRYRSADSGTGEPAKDGIPTSTLCLFRVQKKRIFFTYLLQSEKKHDIIWPEEPKRSYFSRCNLGFYRFWNRTAPQGFAEGNKAMCRQLLEKYNLVPKRGASLAAGAVRGLILTVPHREQIGELYPQVLETLVYGACRELFE